MRADVGEDPAVPLALEVPVGSAVEVCWCGARLTVWITRPIAPSQQYVTWLKRPQGTTYCLRHIFELHRPCCRGVGSVQAVRKRFGDRPVVAISFQNDPKNPLDFMISPVFYPFFPNSETKSGFLSTFFILVDRCPSPFAFLSALLQALDRFRRIGLQEHRGRSDDFYIFRIGKVLHQRCIGKHGLDHSVERLGPECASHRAGCQIPLLSPPAC